MKIFANFKFNQNVSSTYNLNQRNQKDKNKFIYATDNIIAFGNKSTIEELSMLIYKNSLKMDELSRISAPSSNLEKIKKIIEPVVNNNETINFALPAFPFKSPSIEKTFTLSVDKAEEISIAFLKQITSKARGIYPRGLKINIFSDGLIFAPIKGLTDEVAIDYSTKLQKLIDELNATDVHLLTLNEMYPNDYQYARQEILKKYGKTIPEIHNDVRNIGLLNNTFCSIHKFYTEERKGQFPELSSSQNTKEAKRIAYEVIQSANAFGSFIKQYVPNYLRFSCHAQPSTSDKIGIALIENGNQITPWHSVAVKKSDGSFVLMKNATAKKQNLKLIMNAETNQPSHYEVENGQELFIDELNRNITPPFN